MNDNEGIPAAAIELHGNLMREHLIAQADMTAVAEVSSALIDEFLDRLNDYSNTLTVASSLVARALVARALWQVAGAWAADCARQPQEIGVAALRSIMLDPPPSIREHHWNENGAPGPGEATH